MIYTRIWVACSLLDLTLPIWWTWMVGEWPCSFGRNCQAEFGDARSFHHSAVAPVGKREGWNWGWKLMVVNHSWNYKLVVKKWRNCCKHVACQAEDLSGWCFACWYSGWEDEQTVTHCSLIWRSVGCGRWDFGTRDVGQSWKKSCYWTQSHAETSAMVDHPLMWHQQ